MQGVLRSQSGGCRSKVSSRRPRAFSLAELKAAGLADADYPPHVRGRVVCHRPVDGRPDERGPRGGGRSPSRLEFVVSYSYDGFANSIDMLDAFHPQTILAHAMNGGDLSVAHRRSRCGCASSGSWASTIVVASRRHLARVLVVNEALRFVAYVSDTKGIGACGERVRLSVVHDRGLRPGFFWTLRRREDRPVPSLVTATRSRCQFASMCSTNTARTPADVNVVPATKNVATGAGSSATAGRQRPGARPVPAAQQRDAAGGQHGQRQNQQQQPQRPHPRRIPRDDPLGDPRQFVLRRVACAHEDCGQEEDGGEDEGRLQARDEAYQRAHDTL